MKIESITLCNFQCFGSKPTTVKLRKLTALIGNNGCGKTAVLEALCRLFGPPSERRLRRTDFHVPPGNSLETLGTVSLSIEAKIVFPELAEEEEPTTAVPECFRHMVLEEEGGAPFCRVRLEGTWSKGAVPEGEIEEEAWWLKTAEPDVPETEKQRMKAYERGRILVLYVPATRDPARQLRNVSGTLLARVLDAVLWSKPATKAIEGASADIVKAFESESAISLIHDKIQSNWSDLYDEPIYSRPRLRPIGTRLDEVLRHIEMVFAPSEEGTDHDISRLSEGQRSLFYLSLVSAVFDFEQDVLSGALTPTEGNSVGISADRLRAASLTIFAVEEPENHLAPHYLGRIMGLLTKIAKHRDAQVLVTSHSASVLRRINPTSIRYVRLKPKSRTAVVKSVTLPKKADVGEVHKYVREAIAAYPELYFGRLVVLCEGDSEEIVLPRVAKAYGLQADASFVSVVPLGGRHVNHFWRLLSSLKIPYVTLLDLDWGRAGGGWGRIKYACEQLLEIGADRAELLTVSDEGSGTRVLAEKEFAAMGEWSWPLDTVMSWAKQLEKFGVFFSAPLDLDLMMLEALKTNYQVREGADTGPRIPNDESKMSERVAGAIRVVLGEDGSDGDGYSPAQKSLFPWYSYLFLGKGKPSTHIASLVRTTNAVLKDAAPQVLRRLISRMKAKLAAAED